MPQVSIVSPVYNCVKEIEEFVLQFSQLNSIDFELIVVDGGSNDGTKEVLQSLSDQLEFLTFVSEPDNGIYDAMNKGIRLANGQWIYFLGADDRIYDINEFSQVMEELDENSDFVYGDVMKDGVRYDGSFDLQKLISRNICHQAIFFRKEIFSKLGYYSLDYQLLEDYNFNVKVFGRDDIRTKYIDRCLAIYDTSGISSSMVEEKFILDLPKLIKRYDSGGLDFKPAYNYISKLGLQHVYEGRRLKGLSMIIKARLKGADKKFFRNAISHILKFRR